MRHIMEPRFVVGHRLEDCLRTTTCAWPIKPISAHPALICMQNLGNCIPMSLAACPFINQLLYACVRQLATIASTMLHANV